MHGFQNDDSGETKSQSEASHTPDRPASKQNVKDMAANITLWRSKNQPIGELSPKTWGEFFDFLRVPTQCDSKEKLRSWSAATFKDNRRKTSNCLRVSALVLDYDHGTSIDDAMALWGTFYGFLHTSHSHTQSDHRFRVVLPFTKAVSPDEYPSIWAWAQQKAAAANQTIDPATKDVARMWFESGVKEGAVFEAFDLEGEPLDPGTVKLPPPEPSMHRLTGQYTSLNPARTEDSSSVRSNGSPEDSGYFEHDEGAPDTIAEGGRNQYLFRRACALRGKGNEETEIFNAISHLNTSTCDPPLPTEEVIQIARSAMRYPTSSSSAPPAPDTPRTTTGASNTVAGKEFSLTDSGNAERLAFTYGSNFRWSSALGWLVWNGTRWSKDETGQVRLLCKEVARQIRREATTARSDKHLKQIMSHSKDTESRASRNAMADLVKDEPGITIKVEELDRDHWLLNVKNGTIDLQTGLMKPHDPADFITKLAPVEYRSGAVAPTWMMFLEQILPDGEVRAYLQRLAGYWLTGVVRDHVLPVFYGTGSNGKSTFVESLLAIWGDYSRPLPAEELMVRRGDPHPTGRAMLLGLRFAPASETDMGRALSEATVKQLTGGDRITARFMRQDFFNFEATHKISLCTNYKPTIRGTDQGIWRRIHLVSFGVTVPDDKQDRRLKEKLMLEASGILNWAIEGCLAWQREGLAPPKAVLEATQQYRDEMDVVGQFISECCVVERSDPDNTRVGASELFEDFERWCEKMGIHPLSQNNFGSGMTAHGFDRYISNGRKGYKCVRLREHDDRILGSEFDSKHNTREGDDNV